MAAWAHSTAPSTSSCSFSSRAPRHVRTALCRLARSRIDASRCWFVRPCVRPVYLASSATGRDAIRAYQVTIICSHSRRLSHMGFPGPAISTGIEHQFLFALSNFSGSFERTVFIIQPAVRDSALRWSSSPRSYAHSCSASATSCDLGLAPCQRLDRPMAAWHRSASA